MLSRISGSTSRYSTSRSRRRRFTPAMTAAHLPLDAVNSTDRRLGARQRQAAAEAGTGRCPCRAGWEHLATSTQWCWRGEAAATHTDQHLDVTRLCAVDDDVTLLSICLILTSSKCVLTSRPVAHIASFSSTKVSLCAVKLYILQFILFGRVVTATQITVLSPFHDVCVCLAGNDLQ